jgi:hypothetical protein
MSAMKDIKHLAEHEKIHFLMCETCNEYFDCRNLSQVFEHIHEDLPQADFKSSRKMDEPIEYLQGQISIGQN